MALPSPRERARLFAKGVAEQAARTKAALAAKEQAEKERLAKEKAEEQEWLANWKKTIDNDVVYALKSGKKETRRLIRRVYSYSEKAERKEFALAEYCKKAGYNAKLEVTRERCSSGGYDDEHPYGEWIEEWMTLKIWWD